jgi:hypothetical protein
MRARLIAGSAGAKLRDHLSKIWPMRSSASTQASHGADHCWIMVRPPAKQFESFCEPMTMYVARCPHPTPIVCSARFGPLQTSGCAVSRESISLVAAGQSKSNCARRVAIDMDSRLHAVDERRA